MNSKLMTYHLLLLICLFGELIFELHHKFEVLSYDEMSESGTTLTRNRNGTMTVYTIVTMGNYTEGGAVLYIHLSLSETPQG